jgi:hypothetical protein
MLISVFSGACERRLLLLAVELDVRERLCLELLDADGMLAVT